MKIKNQTKTRSTPVHADWRLIFGMLAIALSGGASGQTLDEEYQRYLGDRCHAMEFAREGFLNFVSPGQASEAMSIFCSRLTPLSGGDSVVGEFASGAGSAIGTGAANEDSVLRRRREAARQQSNSTDAIETEMPVTANLSAFVTGDYRHLEQEVTRFAGGRTTDTAGLTVGADYRFGKSAVAGAMLKAKRASGKYAAGGSMDSDSQAIVLYGSISSDGGLFIDASAEIGRTQLESQRFVSLTLLVRDLFGNHRIVTEIPENRADSDIDSIEWGGDLRGGYDFNIGRYTIGPRIGVRYQRNDIESYSEQGDTVMTLAFDDQTEESLRSIAGLQASAAFSVGSIVVVPQLNGEWIREFRNDQRYLTAHFVEDYRPNATQLRFQNEAPDRDVVVGRFSLVAVFQSGVSAFLAGEKMFKHNYQQQYGGSLGIRMEF
jgi:uncharacterized protein YhjY with autotransporter beta-barrel domain